MKNEAWLRIGMVTSLFAESALLVDYTLTVSVSVSAGIRAPNKGCVS